ncbi:MAG TPA: hypothetical protein VMR76_00980 [Candidatus Saccharimonadia bacterium]|nr:hypothetical protein [Candidatus Saccharimonadia bacterium]
MTDNMIKFLVLGEMVVRPSKKDHACQYFPCKWNDLPIHRVSEHRKSKAK